VQWLGSTVLRTCFRVLKPAGKLVLTTNLVGQRKRNKNSDQVNVMGFRLR
jgi:ubiquinone/menaquinone biosynthesis C-methylase UbiE